MQTEVLPKGAWCKKTKACSMTSSRAGHCPTISSYQSEKPEPCPKPAYGYPCRVLLPPPPPHKKKRLHTQSVHQAKPSNIRAKHAILRDCIHVFTGENDKQTTYHEASIAEQVHAVMYKQIVSWYTPLPITFVTMQFVVTTIAESQKLPRRRVAVSGLVASC